MCLLPNCRNCFRAGLASLLLWLAIAVAGCDLPWGRSDAPDFTLKDLYGRTVVLSELRGKIVLLNFWATWAGPCRMGMPHFVRLKRDFGGKDFTVLGITVDEKASLVKRFIDGNPINYTVLVGDFDVVKSYFEDGEEVTLPLTVLVDEDGKVVERFVGFHEYEDLLPAVKRDVDRLAGK